MTANVLYLGIEVFRQCGVNSIRAVASSGQRVAISHCNLEDHSEWLDLVLYGLVGVPSDVRAAVCFSVPTSHELPKAIHGYKSVAAHSPAYALALSRGLSEALAIIVGDSASLVAVVGKGPTVEQDTVRPVAHREARELAVSARCLLKAAPKDLAFRVKRSVVIAGDTDELDRIGRATVMRELVGIGAVAPEIVTDPFMIAEGAMQIAGAQQPAKPLRGSLA